MPSSSPSNFRLIVDAFDDYTKQVGIDLTKNALADALRACDSPNAVFEPLQAKAHAFKDYRDGERKLSSWPKPVVQVVHGFSGVLGKSISLVGRIRPILAVAISTLLLPLVTLTSTQDFPDVQENWRYVRLFYNQSCS
jgi:hypothetical protein